MGKKQHLFVICTILIYIYSAYSVYSEKYSSFEAEALDMFPKKELLDKDSVLIEYSTDNFVFVTIKDSTYYEYALLRNGDDRYLFFEDVGPDKRRSFKTLSLDKNKKLVKNSDQYYNELRGWCKFNTYHPHYTVTSYKSEFKICSFWYFLFLISFFGSFLIQRKSRKVEHEKYIDYNYQLSDSARNAIKWICYVLSVLSLYILWYLYFDIWHLDAFFLTIPQFMIMYICFYFYIRNKWNDLNPDYKGTDNDKPSIHDSYLEQRKPSKSWNPIILIFDFLCQWFPGGQICLFGPLAIIGFPFYAAMYLLTCVRLFIIAPSIYTHCIFVFLISVFLCCILRIDKLYRRLRHKCIKKKNSPGPYGWGTIDYNRADTYGYDDAIKGMFDILAAMSGK